MQMSRDYTIGVLERMYASRQPHELQQDVNCDRGYRHARRPQVRTHDLGVVLIATTKMNILDVVGIVGWAPSGSVWISA